MAKRGRPSKYREEFAGQAFKFCLLGATDKELADFFEISTGTLDAWKAEFPDFLSSLKAGKAEADANVGERLYQRAMGYSNEKAVKIFMPAGAAAPVYAPYTEHYPPDVTACIFWLKNRQRDKWRDRIDQEHTGKDGGPIETTNIDLTKLTLDELRLLNGLVARAAKSAA